MSVIEWAWKPQLVGSGDQQLRVGVAPALLTWQAAEKPFRDLNFPNV